MELMLGMYGISLASQEAAGSRGGAPEGERARHPELQARAIAVRRKSSFSGSQTSFNLHFSLNFIELH